MDGWMDAWICECMDSWLAGWIDGRMDGWMSGWMDGCICGFVNAWIGGWMDGCVYGWVRRRVNEIAVPLDRLFTKRTWSSNFHMQEDPQCELVKIKTFWGVYPRDSNWVDLERNLGICIFLNKCPRLLWARVDLLPQILIHLYFYIFSFYCLCRHHCIVPSLRRCCFQIHLKGSLEGTGVLQVSAAWGSSLVSHQDPLPGCPWTGLDAPSTWEPVGQAVEKPGRGMLSGCSWGEQEGDVCLWTWTSPRGERAS